MAVNLNTTTNSILSEYAATNINLNRMVSQNTETGFYEAMFTGNISYQRTDYVLDAEGHKIGVIQKPIVMPGANDIYSGYVGISSESLYPYLTVISEKAVFEYLAEMADEFIRQDLIKRGIIQ